MKQIKENVFFFIFVLRQPGEKYLHAYDLPLHFTNFLYFFLFEGNNWFRKIVDKYFLIFRNSFLFSEISVIYRNDSFPFLG